MEKYLMINKKAQNFISNAYYNNEIDIDLVAYDLILSEGIKSLENKKKVRKPKNKDISLSTFQKIIKGKLPVDETILVENNIAHMNNGDIQAFCICKEPIEDGLYKSFEYEKPLKSDININDIRINIKNKGNPTTINYNIDDLKFVSKAMSDTQSRPHLNGVYVDLKEKVIVATDGHRIHTKDINIMNIHKKSKSILIPKEIVNLIIKYKVNKISIYEDSISFDFSNIHIDALFDNDVIYPDWKSLFIKAEEEAFENININIPKNFTKYNNKFFVTIIDKNRNLIATYNKDIKVYGDDFKIDKDLCVGFNTKYLIEFLNGANILKGKLTPNTECMISKLIVNDNMLAPRSIN